MNVKDELKKVIEEMERIMVTMDALGSLHPQWAMGAWDTLDIFKPKLEAILHRLIKEGVP